MVGIVFGCVNIIFAVNPMIATDGLAKPICGMKWFFVGVFVGVGCQGAQDVATAFGEDGWLLGGHQSQGVMEVEHDVAPTQAIDAVNVPGLENGAVADIIADGVVESLTVAFDADESARAGNDHEIQAESPDGRGAFELPRDHCVGRQAFLNIVVEAVLDGAIAGGEVGQDGAEIDFNDGFVQIHSFVLISYSGMYSVRYIAT